MAKFNMQHNLESLNEKERQEYVLNICKYLQVPPELNLIVLVYIDDGEGPRRLVAYAKRGATEIIRNNLEINVIDLTSEERHGSIVFYATGKDSKGRQEKAVGSKYIAGLTGRELDNAIMTAQTRAVRRMTLQFAGAGVLDESEVNSAVAVEVIPAVQVPVAVQPMVEPNSAAGCVAPEAGNSQLEYSQLAREKQQEEWEKQQEEMR